MPIFQSSNFEHGTRVAGLQSPSANAYDEIVYGRLNNTPNHNALHQKLAAIEGGQAALVTASGMAAISTTLLTVLKAGDHLVAQTCLYGGTHSLLLHDLTDWGISVTLVDGDDWDAHIRPNTKAIYVESMSNPLLQVPDLDAVLACAKQHQLVSLIDNTFASPVNFRPLEFGFDLCIHSATKYLNGHSDQVAGAIVGSKHWLDRVTHRANHLGACLDPHGCFLLNRGLKTLKLRVLQQNQNAQKLAEFLASHPAVAEVHYPGLPNHSSHQRARKYFQGYGGVLSFELRPKADSDNFCKQLHLVTEAASLGGVETLIVQPWITSHAGLTTAEKQATGIREGLMRVAVGIEDIEDILNDFRQALEQTSHTKA
jgi:cystathionine beta-lyase/cystathionine gamma-synthase